jgi:hypothetical protein
MDQSSQFDTFDPFFSLLLSLPSLSLLLTNASDASDALSLSPLATYPSKEALFEAIQSWSKLRGYAFTIARSIQINNRRQKVFYACDCCSPIRLESRIERIQDT